MKLDESIVEDVALSWFGDLFGVQRPAITKHLGKIFASEELAEASVCSIWEHTAGDGKTYSATLATLRETPLPQLLSGEVSAAKAGLSFLINRLN